MFKKGLNLLLIAIFLITGIPTSVNAKPKIDFSTSIEFANRLGPIENQLNDDEVFFGKDEGLTDDEVFFGEGNGLSDDEVFFGEDQGLTDDEVFFGEGDTTKIDICDNIKNCKYKDYDKDCYAPCKPKNPPKDDDDCDYFKPCKGNPKKPKPSSCPDRFYPTDIDDHWAEIYIRRLYDLCITEGDSFGFHPNRYMIKAELTKTALAAVKIAPDKGCYDADCGTPFIDLELTWYTGWVRSAWVYGIVEGSPIPGSNKKLFRPKQNVTREQAVKIILSSFGVQPGYVSKSFFKDVKGWSVPWIEIAHQIGIVQGIGNGNFDPTRATTRAEVAKMIVKSMEYFDTDIKSPFRYGHLIEIN